MKAVKLTNLNCPKHGDYLERNFKSPITGNIVIMDTCQKCDVDFNNLREISELAEKKNKANDFASRKKLSAGVSRRNLNKTFEDYVCETPLQQKAKIMCQQFTNDFPNSKNLLMLGSVGTGKTHLASAVIDSLINTNECLIVKAIDMIRALKDTWRNDSNQTELSLIKKFSDMPLLIIDEVGTQFGSDTEKLFMFDIIDGRYQNVAPTILISNLDTEGLKEIIGERCLDRLREDGGSVVAFNWASQRPTLTGSDNVKNV